MAGAAQNFTYLAVMVMAMMISAVFGAEEAEAPSPYMLTGAASMAFLPTLTEGFIGSLLAIFACLFL
ncbi:hypothetical protein SUGI_0015530 [Cryptomeria japonica]|nr:hypothetical protein SUGI_0015530 [Cryptomeria japonica]